MTDAVANAIAAVAAAVAAAATATAEGRIRCSRAREVYLLRTENDTAKYPRSGRFYSPRNC